MRERVTFVSPHLDDVVLSCPRWVLWEAERAEVTIVSVFTASTDALVRKAEDRRATALLGASAVHLDLLDAPVLGFLGFEGLLMGCDRPSREVVEALGRALSGADRVYGPLGVGNHVDHRATHTALAALAPPGLRWYVDQPYARVEGLLAMRLGSPCDRVAFAKSFEETPWVQAFTAPSARSSLTARFPANASPFAGALLATRAEPAPRAAEAVRAYSSQVGALYGASPLMPAEEPIYAFERVIRYWWPRPTSRWESKMKFSPRNEIVRLCMQGMGLEERGHIEEARNMFLRAWNEATDDHEKLLAAYHVSRRQEDAADRLKWLETALQLAVLADEASVRAAIPLLYSRIAECHESLNELDAAGRYQDLAAAFEREPADRGPFYHGTRADLQVGDYLSAGNQSNHKSGLVMNHVYFTALVDGAGLAAALSRGEGPERVYVVEPAGSFEDDPNVTNKRFPGNPTRSYRSEACLKIVGEVLEWERPAPEEIRKWRERLANTEGDIIS